MDLSTLSQSTPVPDNNSEDASIFNVNELPWRTSELEAFRKFLMDTRRGPGRRKSGTDNGRNKYVLDVRNLCIIKGQTGSGKMTTVKRLCREFDIKIVEFDQFNTVLNKEQEYENSIDHLLRFLRNSLSRSSLKSSKSSGMVNESVSVGNRSLKRMKSSHSDKSTETQSGYNKSGSNDDEQGQLVLIKDLPRALINCKFAALYPVQNILNEVLNSDKLYPLVIVTLDTKEDSTIMRRLLSSNYTKDRRCLVITLKEITKSKIFSILKLKKSTLVNHIIDISAGDIRYILNNLKFYNINSGLGSESVYEYMLERNNLNNFNLLGKILFNKRVPIQIKSSSNVASTGNKGNSANSSNEDNTSNTGADVKEDSTSSADESRKIGSAEVKNSDDTPTGVGHSKIWTRNSTQWVSRIGNTSPSSFTGSASPSVTSSNLYSPSNATSNVMSQMSVTSGLMSPATRNSSNINSPASSVTNVIYNDVVRYLKFNRCFSMSRPVMNKLAVEKEESKGTQSSSSSQEKALSTQERLKRSVDKVPLSIKLDGITEEYDPKRPLSYTKWPKIVPKEDTPNFRQSSSRMLPKLTRPMLGYRPEELIDSVKSDPSYFSNCIFDNYSDLYGSIDDCSAFTRHFTSADVFFSANWYSQDQETGRHFLSICIRAAADCNIHGFEANRRGFHHFIPHTNYKVKVDHIRGLVQEFKLELSRHNVASYTHESLLLEIIPILSMVTEEEEALTEAYSQSQSQPMITEDEYDILDVMEQVEMMMEKGETKQSSAARFKESNIFTAKLSGIVHEIGKYYVTKESR